MPCKAIFIVIIIFSQKRGRNGILVYSGTTVERKVDNISRAIVVGNHLTPNERSPIISIGFLEMC